MGTGREVRSVSHKAPHPPLCRRKQPLYGVSSETASRKIEGKGERDRNGRAGTRGRERGGVEGKERREWQNLSSEFLILRNRRRIPERFHSGPAISGISLAPFPGTLAARRARVNGLFGFTDSCLPLFLSSSSHDPHFDLCLSFTTRNLSIDRSSLLLYPFCCFDPPLTIISISLSL